MGKMQRKDEMETLVNKKPPPDEGTARKAARAGVATHKALITRNLRLAYGEVASEPVPQRLLDLLEARSTARRTKSHERASPLSRPS